MPQSSPEISIILPCLNEEQAIDSCLDSIQTTLHQNNLNAEIIIVDNGSDDKSCQIASKRNVNLVHEKKRGYGAAYLKGFEQARGKYIFLSDIDGSYDFKEIPRFIEPLKNGHNFVIGNRFAGTIENQAMPWHHRFIGNPLLSWLLKLFFKSKVNDAHCGMRAITKDSLDQLKLKTSGMEFASEMIIKAIICGLKIKEIPINYYKRLGHSKLRSITDGCRHLRFMLLYSPLFLFFMPGLLIFALGLISMTWLYFGSPTILGIKLFFHPMFFSSIFMIIGYQTMLFSLFAKTYAITHLDVPSPKIQSLYKYVKIETGFIIGSIFALIGIAIFSSISFSWIKSGFETLNKEKAFIAALTFIAIGTQTIFSSFMLSILGIEKR